MGKAARRVPAQWQHPKDENGRYLPLRDGTQYERRARAWDDEEKKWREGLRRDEITGPWKPIEVRFRSMTYAECNGPRPDPKNYTPQWSPSECTHWQYYEEVTDGTPISPVCGSAEELAHWLFEHDRGVTLDGKSLRPSTYREILAGILREPLAPIH
jgi:hypothetical protein